MACTLIERQPIKFKHKAMVKVKPRYATGYKRQSLSTCYVSSYSKHGRGIILHQSDKYSKELKAEIRRQYGKSSAIHNDD